MIMMALINGRNLHDVIFSGKHQVIQSCMLVIMTCVMCACVPMYQGRSQGSIEPPFFVPICFLVVYSHGSIVQS